MVYPVTISTVFLTNRKQKVVLSGQSFPWINVEAGARQGFILGPLSNKLATNPNFFANDTSLFFCCQEHKFFCM